MSRPISYLEDLYRLRNAAGCYSCCQVAGLYSVDLSRELLWRALRKLVLQYSQLSLQVFANEGHHEIRPLDCYTLDEVLEVRDDCGMLELISDINKRYFSLNVQSPLWRLILVGKNRLVFYYEHLLFDGTSGKNFHILLRDALAEALAEKDAVDAAAPLFDHSRDVLPATNPDQMAFVDYRPSVAFAARVVFHEFAPRWLKSLLQPFSKFPLIMDLFERRDLARQPGVANDVFELVQLSREQVTHLVALARDHGVKLTALLAMMMHVSLLPTVGNKYTDTSIPVNLRRYMFAKPGPPELGLFMAEVNVKLLPAAEYGVVADECNWSLAAAVQDQLNQGLSSSMKPIGLLKHISPRDYLESKLKSPRTTTMEISNLGTVASTSPVKLLRLTFAQPLGLTGPYFGVNVIGADTGVDIVLVTSSEMAPELAQAKAAFLRLLDKML
ncbi:hypothetical protein KL929_001619 [Ogataea haglerorum]|uniref:uncharacterized protein n=1 Tax=Ogataea haglerorum TaxID=1937702 RepID=UPI001C8A7749|nr:uncharacterized protein KL911_000290 [Ogataea haglerorum]KAG7699108.1 hypothetical protein KL915_001400 [Ogataea haglerorum]KAG7759153.1 hypothetical protein KL911_000290 [Ogataea haglerorum]KAG7759889.1 hypothetical protein KL947_001519 [Ogataea haglerorum]KAG7798576.1 hypothetical protein KL929_001619 [Ogataea haglerorum]KAG7803446.1 hypothetical protein KL944_001399 [Ogataea haglerorum]